MFFLDEDAKLESVVVVKGTGLKSGLGTTDFLEFRSTPTRGLTAIGRLLLRVDTDGARPASADKEDEYEEDGDLGCKEHVLLCSQALVLLVLGGVEGRRNARIIFGRKIQSLMAWIFIGRSKSNNTQPA